MMNESNILIIGADGQLGTALRQKYPNAKTTDTATLDITDKASVHAFDWENVQVIINAAAYTNVDGAETSDGRTAAWRVNADAVANLVAVTAQIDAVLIHISSDYVFDGTATPHTEEEPFSPLSSYGASKAAGDIAASLAPKHYILRTSWVIGEGKNFVRTMLDLGKKGVSPTVVADQIGRLTFTSEIVRAIDHLLTSQAQGGTYNISNSGSSASWADITREIFTIANFTELTVTDTTTEDYYTGKDGIAPRPLQSTLDLTKLESTGFVCNDWKEDLKTYIQKELSK